jgi:hypothetical protein
MQFYAVEIARYVVFAAAGCRFKTDSLRRNRLGLNDWIYEQAQKEKANASKSSA